MSKSFRPYLLYFIILTLLFSVLGVLLNFAPFGKYTLLTVDLGQQYIDFFSLYKETLSQNPQMLVYSFQKGMGGEMLGLWAYYLMSPFNIILLAFPDLKLDVAVALITYCKVLAAGFSFIYFSQKKYQLESLAAVAFTLCYSLMSYTMAYLLNIMWLDGLVLLPIIALGLDWTLKYGSSRLYIISLAIMMMANYYIAYMICLFLSFYALYALIENQASFSWAKSFRAYLAFVKDSIIAALIAGIVLIPTLFSIRQNKGEYFKWDLSLKLAHDFTDIFSKLFLGAFDFEELKAGSPNLFAGSLIIIGLIFYFSNRKIRKREKLAALMVFAIFMLSFRYEILDRLWHGGQFPIWYHFRFSFLCSFFAIELALKQFKNRPQDYGLVQVLLSLTIYSILAIYYLWKSSYAFLSPWFIFLSLAFFLVELFILQFDLLKRSYRQILLLAIVSVELLTNASLILNNFSYVRQDKFRDYVTLLDQATESLKHQENDFYRIHKVFMRTKNEAMFSHYNGLDHFSSTIEAHVPALYGYLGQPDGNGFAAYTNGTLFTDDFFNVRYLVDLQNNPVYETEDKQYHLYPEATDLDINYYPTVMENDRFKVKKNDKSLSLAMELGPGLETANFRKHLPVENQETLLRLIDFKGSGQAYFEPIAFDKVSYQNVEVTDKGDGDYYTYQSDLSKNQSGHVLYEFTTDSAPYYFTLPSQLNKDNSDFKLNNENYEFYTPYRRRQITNASFDMAGPQTLDHELKESKVQANLPYLYRFDLERYEKMIDDKQNHLFQVDQFTHTSIKGHISTIQDEGYLLFSIPYDPAWQIKIDGQKVESLPVLSSTLLACKIQKGNHQVELDYKPSSLLYGATSLGLGLCLFILQEVYRLKKRKDNKLQNI